MKTQWVEGETVCGGGGPYVEGELETRGVPFTLDESPNTNPVWKRACKTTFIREFYGSKYIKTFKVFL